MRAGVRSQATFPPSRAARPGSACRCGPAHGTAGTACWTRPTALGPTPAHTPAVIDTTRTPGLGLPSGSHGVCSQETPVLTLSSVNSGWRDPRSITGLTDHFVQYSLVALPWRLQHAQSTPTYVGFELWNRRVLAPTPPDGPSGVSKSPVLPQGTTTDGQFRMGKGRSSPPCGGCPVRPPPRETPASCRLVAAQVTASPRRQWVDRSWRGWQGLPRRAPSRARA